MTLPPETPDRPAPIDALLAAVVERLADTLPGRVAVQLYPDRPAEWDFANDDAAVLVAYAGSRFAEVGPAGAQGVREAVRVAVVLLLRGLAGPFGAGALIAEVRSALHGRALAGATGLRPVEIDLDGEDDGVWTYRMIFEGGLVAVPSPRRAPPPVPRGFVSPGA